MQRQITNTGSISILHVDDDPDFAELTATFLEREDDSITVDIVTSASDGLDRLETTKIDCIVSDYEMPGQNGIEFLQAVREEYPELPFILFTGKGSEEVASDAIAAGVNHYLQKGSGTDQFTLLVNKIKQAVERYRAQQTQERHLEAIETAQEGISILNEDGEFIYVNERYADLYGYEPEEMLGEHWELIYPDNEIAFARDEILPTVADEGYWHGESTGLRADGTTFPEDHVVSQTNQDDLVCTVRDLTSQQEQEAELRWKTRAMDEAPVGITISDPTQDDNPLIYANEQFTTITGYETEEILGYNCRFLQGETTDPEPVTAMREAVDAQKPVTVELRNYRKDGTEFWNRVKIAPVENDDGEVTNFVGFQEDITERKERTQELRQYERIINTIQEAACIYDEDARFVAVNEYLAEFYNTTPEALVGQSSNLIPQIRARKDGDPFQELLDGDREEVHGEFEGEFPGVGYEVLAYQLTPLEIDGDIQGVVGVAYEVTERKERERELKQRNRQLDEFTSVVSHDLQTPLSVAEGRLELAQEECDSDHLDDALSAIKRSQELIDELLTLAREGTELGEIESVALSEVVEQSWQTVDTANATLVTDTDRTVRADRSRLQQLLENLIRNAIKYGGEDVTVTVGTLADGFYIEDDGPGIPADERERVLDAGYSTDDDSTGFGLAIVNQISEAHGWTISVGESEHGGARFAITDVTVVE